MRGAISKKRGSLAGLGGVLQTRPHPQALPTTRRLDSATHLVASVPALAQCGLETASCVPALRRVRARSLTLFNSFAHILASLSLRESCLHEMCTGSLGGGRRPARKRASSDPRRVPVAGRVLVTPLERQSRRAPLPTKACQYHRTIRPLRSQVLLSSKGGRNTKEG